MAAYLVKNKQTGKEVIVETRTKSGARNHVSQDDYEVRTLNTSELIKAIKAGMEIEVIGEQEDTPVEAEVKPASNKNTPVKPSTAAKAANPVSKKAA